VVKIDLAIDSAEQERIARRNQRVSEERESTNNIQDSAALSRFATN
jgi:hypothetical protein